MPLAHREMPKKTLQKQTVSDLQENSVETCRALTICARVAEELT